MRTQCLANARPLLLVSLAAVALFVSQIITWPGRATEELPTVVRFQSGLTGTLKSERNRTKVTIGPGDPGSHGSILSVNLSRDRQVAPFARVLGAEAVGAIQDRVFIITDSYPSRPGGLSYCRAGEEQFLRVLAVIRHRLRETLRLKLASCRDNVELASNGLQWAPDNSTLSVHWLSAPGNEQRQATQEYQIDPSGAPKLLVER
jgi:hypothetical protein